MLNPDSHSICEAKLLELEIRRHLGRRRVSVREAALLDVLVSLTLGNGRDWLEVPASGTLALACGLTRGHLSETLNALVAKRVVLAEGDWRAGTMRLAVQCEPGAWRLVENIEGLRALRARQARARLGQKGRAHPELFAREMTLAEARSRCAADSGFGIQDAVRAGREVPDSGMQLTKLTGTSSLVPKLDNREEITRAGVPGLADGVRAGRGARGEGQTQASGDAVGRSAVAVCKDDYRGRAVDRELRDALREWLGPCWRGNEGFWTNVVKFDPDWMRRTLGDIRDGALRCRPGRRGAYLNTVANGDGILERMRRVAANADSSDGAHKGSR